MPRSLNILRPHLENLLKPNRHVGQLALEHDDNVLAVLALLIATVVLLAREGLQGSYILVYR
jgi:hypothetical protein